MFVHPGENPLDLKVFGEKTFAESMALLRGATVTRGRLRGPGGSGMTGGGGMAGPHIREILIFEGAIFSLRNHPFYCSFCQSVFKTVFVTNYATAYIQRCVVDNLPTDEAPHVLLSCGEIVQGSVETMYQG